MNCRCVRCPCAVASSLLDNSPLSFTLQTGNTTPTDSQCIAHRWCCLAVGTDTAARRAQHDTSQAKTTH